MFANGDESIKKIFISLTRKAYVNPLDDTVMLCMVHTDINY